MSSMRFNLRRLMWSSRLRLRLMCVLVWFFNTNCLKRDTQFSFTFTMSTSMYILLHFTSTKGWKKVNTLPLAEARNVKHVRTIVASLSRLLSAPSVHWRRHLFTCSYSLSSIKNCEIFKVCLLVMPYTNPAASSCVSSFLRICLPRRIRRARYRRLSHVEYLLLFLLRKRCPTFSL